MSVCRQACDSSFVSSLEKVQGTVWEDEAQVYSHPWHTNPGSFQEGLPQCQRCKSTRYFVYFFTVLFNISNRALLTSYIIYLQLRYKETFELAKGHYHADKDALDILCAKRVRDDISEVSKLRDLLFALNMNVI